MSHVTLNKGLVAASSRHPKPPDFNPNYGTAGFRATASLLDSTLFRCGILAGLRAQQCSAAVGLMVTASHNPEPDNGVKMVESSGEMLVPAWESHATTVANASTDQELLDALLKLISSENISSEGAATVVIGGDTRPHTQALVQVACEGVQLTGASVLNIGTCTTPVLHYSVLLQNESGLAPYEERLVQAFKCLTAGCKEPELEIVVDCANGVGALVPASLFSPVARPEDDASSQLSQMPDHGLRIRTINTPCPTPDTAVPTGLNDHCGSDHVQTQMQWPRGLSGANAAKAACCASLDGDADRIIFYYPASTPADDGAAEALGDQAPTILDGDYIAALVATFAQELITALPTSEDISLGVIQTTYANGASTHALQACSVATELALTGVKHLHHAAKAFDVGVYFEANGHGSVLFGPRLLHLLAHLEAAVASGVLRGRDAAAVQEMRAFEQIVNPAVGDAWSNLLLVAAILKRGRMTAPAWRALYSPLAARLAVVRVADRNAIETTCMDTRATSPAGLQEAIDEAVEGVPQGRAFVRPSGTQDVVRVYAEAESQHEADALALCVLKLVHTLADGVGEVPTGFL